MKTVCYTIRITIALFLMLTGYFSFGQCNSVAPASASCSGTLLTNGTNITSGTYYYSGTGTLSSVSLNGGTLMICGTLTITSFTTNFYGGTLIIEPGGNLTIGTSSTNVNITGNGGSIVNYGTFTLNGNLSIGSNNFWNLPSSQGFTVAGNFTLTGGYFINTANNTSVTVTGLTKLSGGSVCMGNFASMNTNTLSSSGSYIKYNGTTMPACFGVSTSSNLSNTSITTSSMINICLAPGETQTSSNWGSANVSTNCQGCNIVLPLNIINFTTLNQGDAIKLSWLAENVTGNEIFDVEKSDDGIGFQSMGVVKAALNQTEYTFKDNSINNVLQYYRIKETNPSGKSLYSTILFVKTGFNQNLTIYPNPATTNSFVNILFTSEKQENVFLSLMDISGKLIYTKTNTLTTGKNKLAFDIKNIPAGIYILKIQTTSQGNFYNKLNVINN